MKISVTHHDNGRAFRETRERFISMRQALDIHDPLINPSYKGLAAGPLWDKGESYGAEWRGYFVAQKWGVQ